MESSTAPTVLAFCTQCESLRIGDVKDQLQKLFTEKPTQPNTCGICRKSVKSQDLCDASQIIQLKKEQTGGHEQVRSDEHALGYVSRNNDIKTERLDTIDHLNDVDEESVESASQPEKVTRLRTGVIKITHYVSDNSGTSDIDDNNDDDTDSDYDPEKETNHSAYKDVTREREHAKQDKITESREGDKVKAPRHTWRSGIDPALLELMGPMDDPTMPFNCKFCSVPFAYLSGFQNHVKRHTGKNPMECPFKCDVCGKSYPSRTDLQYHKTNVHKDNKQFKCTRGECTYAFNNNVNLQNHLRFHRRVNRHMCETCGLSFKDKHACKVHKTIHTGLTPYQCKLCDKSFSHQRLLMKHQYARHSQNERLKCDGCHFTCCSKYDLRIHKKRHCGNRGAFRCERCEQIFILKTRLDKHVKLNKCKPSKPPYSLTVVQQKDSVSSAVKVDMHDTKWLDPRVIQMMGETSSTSLRFKCKHCLTKEWRTPGPFIKHMRLSHPEEPVVTRPYICDQCAGASFLMPADLSKHLMYHSLGEKPFVCNQAGCGKLFRTPMTFKSHEKNVHNPGPRQHMCSTCGTCYRSVYQLEHHESRVHRGVRPYKCQECDKAFGDNAKLQEHIRRLHSNERPWICEQCGRRFTDQKDLASHTLVVHSGAKPFACEHCEYRCARSDYLVKHRRIHTGEKPYQCQQCPQNFAVRTSLVLHVKKHHPNDPAAPTVVTKKSDQNRDQKTVQTIEMTASLGGTHSTIDEAVGSILFQHFQT